MAVPFDPQRLTATGAAVPVVEGVLQSPSSEPPSTASPLRGHWSMFRGAFSRPRAGWCGSLAMGLSSPLPPLRTPTCNPRLSPDGRRVAVAITEQESQIWLYDLSRDTLTRFTFEGKANNNPSWTPDGKRIAFTSTKEGPRNLFWQLADGSGGLERLTTSESRFSGFLVPGWATAGLC